jgi:hypothetical protein
MTPRHPSQPLSTRLAILRHDIARFSAFRRRRSEQPGGVRQPSKYSLLMLIALAAIGMVAAISVIQLLEAALS